VWGLFLGVGLGGGGEWGLGFVYVCVWGVGGGSLVDTGEGAPLFVPGATPPGVCRSAARFPRAGPATIARRQKKGEPVINTL